METFDFEGQVGGSAHGAIVRILRQQKPVTAGATCRPIAVSLGQGVGGNSLNPAAALVRASPSATGCRLVGSGDLSPPEEALDNAAEEYIAEATAQGYIGG